MVSPEVYFGVKRHQQSVVQECDKLAVACSVVVSLKSFKKNAAFGSTLTPVAPIVAWKCVPQNSSRAAGCVCLAFADRRDIKDVIR